jgi:hypothetical protein
MLALVFTAAVAVPQNREDFVANVLGGDHPRDSKSTPYDKPAEELVDEASEAIVKGSKWAPAFLELEKRDKSVSRDVENQFRTVARRQMRRSLHPVAPLLHSKLYTHAGKQELLARLEGTAPSLEEESWDDVVSWGRETFIDPIVELVQEECQTGHVLVQVGCDHIEDTIGVLYNEGKDYVRKVKSESKQLWNAAKKDLGDFADFVEEQAHQVVEWMKSLVPCGITASDLLDLIGGREISDVVAAFDNVAEDWQEMRGAARKLDVDGALDAAETAIIGAVASAACNIVWGVLGTVTGLRNVANLLHLINRKCKVLGDVDPTIAVGVVGGISVDIAGGVAVEGAAGLEVGMAMSTSGAKMCYIGGCATVTMGVGAKVGASVGVEAGLAISFFKTPGNIPGKCTTYGIGFDVDVSLGAGVGAGVGLDLFTGCGNGADTGSTDGLCYAEGGSMKDDGFTNMLKDTFGGGATFSAGVSAGAGGGVSAGYATGVCNTPICIRTDGLGCDGKDLKSGSNFGATSSALVGRNLGLEADEKMRLSAPAQMRLSAPAREHVKNLKAKKHRLEKLHSQPMLERKLHAKHADHDVSTVDVPALEKMSAMLGDLESQLDEEIDSALAEVDSTLDEIDSA